MADTKVEAQLVTGNPPHTRAWYAWNDLMPPTPDFVHVVGEVRVPNPGVEAQLTYREPQGFNPSILLLDLRLHQRPGIWPQMITWKPARYDAVLGGIKYSRAVIFYDGVPLTAVDVRDIAVAHERSSTGGAGAESLAVTEVPLPRRSISGWSGENPFPWIASALPVCFSGGLSKIEVDFCMDGARYSLSLHPDVRIRVKGATAAIDQKLADYSVQRVIVTVCGRFQWSPEQGCQYLLASHVSPMEQFVAGLQA
jgi:hypothetical protein